jgi:hypothetical protein
MTSVFYLTLYYDARKHKIKVQRGIFNQKRVEEMLQGKGGGEGRTNMDAKAALVWMLYDVVMDCSAASVGDYWATFWDKATVPRNSIL